MSNPTASRFLESCAGEGCGAHDHRPAIGRAWSPVHVPVRLQTTEQSRHGRAGDLLRRRQLRRRPRIPEHQHGQDRQARWSQSRPRIFPPDPAKDMDGYGMQPRRYIGSVQRRFNRRLTSVLGQSSCVFGERSAYT